MEREGFVFYKSFWNAVKDLDAETFKDCVSSICAYAIEGRDCEPDGIAGMVLELVKPQIDANNKRYESGKKGGAPSNKNQDEKPLVTKQKTKGNSKDNQRLCDEEPKEKEKVKEKEKEKEKVKETDILPLISDFSGILQETVKDWMAYKKQRGDAYVEVGLKNWIGQIKNYRKTYSDKTIAGVISRTMAQGYQGVVWDWLKNEPHKPKVEVQVMDTGPKDVLPPDEQEAKMREMKERLGGMFGS